MSTLVVENISDGTVSATTEKVARGNTHAYAIFLITGGIPSIPTGSYNVASVTDGGVGEPWINLTTALLGVNDGAAFISPALHSGGQEYAV